MRRFASVALLALLAAGCSRVSLGWRFAPWMLQREAASMLALPDAQRQALGEDAHAYLDHVALHEAGRLAAWGRQLSFAVETGRDSEALGWLFDSADQHWDALLKPGVAPAARWLAFEPPQRAQALKKAFDERNARDFARWADPKKATADRHKRLRNGLRDYLGDLTELQEEGLRDWAERAEFPVEGWRADRLRRQQALLASLEKGGPQLEAQLEKQLQGWWLSPQADRDPAYQKELEAYRGRLRTAAAQLLASLTPAQRERLARRLHALADDIGAIGLRAQTETAKKAAK